jgi:hypothetical protein
MSWTTLAGLPTAHVFGYLWPVYPPDGRLTDWFLLGRDFADHLATRSWAWMAKGQLYAAYALFAVLLVGLVPWRKILAWLWPREKAVPRPLSKKDAPVGEWWLVALWIILPSLALMTTWIPHDWSLYQTIWGTRAEKPLWEPRYLGMIVPAWLLWLAACLRRLPFLPLRAVAIAAAVGVCAYSSLANHLTYRNAPLNRQAEIVERIVKTQSRSSVAVAFPAVKYVEPAVNVATTIARHVVPQSAEDQSYQPAYTTGRSISSCPSDMATESQFANWLQNVSRTSRYTTIVMTDRFGDMTNPSHMLSDESVKRLLGPGWTLVETETYAWHYEWRYYIFHTWRTRVFKRTP